MKIRVKCKKFCKYFGCSILLLFLMVGIPVIINELYKLDCGYLTIWSGADVLGYYGTLVGAGVTIFVLCWTICFTRKQIRHDRYIQIKTDKWKNIETAFNEVLICIQPFRLANIILAEKDNFNSNEGSIWFLRFLNEVSMTCEKFTFFIGNDEKIALEDVLTTYLQIYDKLQDIYMEFDAIVKKQEYTTQYGQEMVEKLRNLHLNDYTALLNLRKKSFDAIYESIEEEAEKILK